MSPDDFTLAEFVAWCRGEGRDPGAGWHHPALQLVENFLLFKRGQHETPDDARE